MSVVFFTGFPGFLGSELLPRVLRRAQSARAICLVQEKFLPLARQRVQALVAAEAKLRGRIELVTGDITRSALGLADADAIAAETVEIFHLAAIYDLAVRRDLAIRVNVDGTRRVLDFAARCPRLGRVQYVSTCYVSGRYAGIFREADLDRGQEFNNFYEESKFLAEVELAKRMADGLPATIYRPGIVVGDSRTGETQKFDGPYYILRLLLKQPLSVAVLPVPGDPKTIRVNLVPCDFVIAAIDYLSRLPEAIGRVYQLADPDPPTAEEALDLFGRATGKAIVRVPTPVGLAKSALAWLPGAQQITGLPAPVVDYYVQPTFYDTTNASRDLGPAGIRCPPLADYLPQLVAFLRAHPEIGSEAMT